MTPPTISVHTLLPWSHTTQQHSFAILGSLAMGLVVTLVVGLCDANLPLKGVAAQVMDSSCSA